MVKRSCCFECKERNPSCHAECERYAAEFSANEERRKAEKERREKANAFYTAAFERRRREALIKKK